MDVRYPVCNGIADVIYIVCSGLVDGRYLSAIAGFSNASSSSNGSNNAVVLIVIPVLLVIAALLQPCLVKDRQHVVFAPFASRHDH